eukprot:763082-Hanusia_phi.AAC.2
MNRVVECNEQLYYRAPAPGQPGRRQDPVPARHWFMIIRSEPQPAGPRSKAPAGTDPGGGPPESPGPGSPIWL